MEIQLTDYELIYLKLVASDCTYPEFASFEDRSNYYDQLTRDCLNGVFDVDEVVKRISKGLLYESIRKE